MTLDIYLGCACVSGKPHGVRRCQMYTAPARHDCFLLHKLQKAIREEKGNRLKHGPYTEMPPCPRCGIVYGKYKCYQTATVNVSLINELNLKLQAATIRSVYLPTQTCYFGAGHPPSPHHPRAMPGGRPLAAARQAISESAVSLPSEISQYFFYGAACARGNGARKALPRTGNTHRTTHMKYT